MIKIMLGSMGSGKTVCTVRELILNPSRKVTYSNIITNHINNNVLINKDMIIQKELIHTKKTGEEVYKYKLNQDFWKGVIKKEQSINVILDEAHTIIDARRSMSPTNKVMNDFMSLLRRILGASESGSGELILISQLERRLDIVAKELCTCVKYHVCHYVKTCRICGHNWRESNEIAEPRWKCMQCRSYDIFKHEHVIEVWHFTSMENFVAWKYFGKTKRHYRRYYVTDIEKYFPFYDTYQWDNLISEV